MDGVVGVLEVVGGEVDDGGDDDDDEDEPESRPGAWG